MKKFVISLVGFLAASLTYIPLASACTDFQVTAKDGTLVIARSMEFASDLKSNLRSSPRGRSFTTTIDGGTGASWKSKYGYLYLDGMDHDMAVDGMNEAGLSFEFLYLPGETQYQNVPDGKASQSLPYYLLGDWALGNFKTVDEVRQALANIYVVQQTIPGLSDVIFPLHAAIHDASGKGIVVEFTKGEMQIYDYMGTLTNSPTYPWHISNLRNFINLSPINPKPVIANGITYAATGQGAGTFGLPGDISPPSRFVKVSFLSKVAYPAIDAAGAINLAEHIINNVDIPSGLSRAMNGSKESSELTQWAVFKDLTHKKLYYRVYTDMTLRSVAMDKIDFSENAPKLKMPLVQPTTVIDMTDKFLNKNPPVPPQD